MKKIVSILIMIMLTCTGFVLIDNDFNVEGSSGGGSDWVNETLLDYTYMFDILDNLTYVVHNDSIWGAGDEVIRMGRAFGTLGDNWTAIHIKERLENLSLEPVQKIPLQTIEIDYDNKKWRCDYKIETVDYNLTFNHPGWEDEWSNDGHIPKNESFVMPSGKVYNKYLHPGFGKMDFNNSFSNSKIVPIDLDQGGDIFLDGATFDNYMNVSIDEVTNTELLYGFVTYLSIGENLPDDQEGRLFIFDEEQGCEEQLDNVTNASGVILIHNDTKGNESYTVNTSSYQNISIGRSNITNNNVTEILDMLKNETPMIAGNTHNSEILTFYHNFSHLTWWPQNCNNGFLFLDDFENKWDKIFEGLGWVWIQFLMV